MSWVIEIVGELLFDLLPRKVRRTLGALIIAILVTVVAVEVF